MAHPAFSSHRGTPALLSQRPLQLPIARPSLPPPVSLHLTFHTSRFDTLQSPLACLGFWPFLLTSCLQTLCLAFSELAICNWTVPDTSSSELTVALAPDAEARAEAAAAVERETRLARMVEQLRRRLEQQQAENLQLEDLLRQADASLSGALTIRYCRITLHNALGGTRRLQQQQAEKLQLEDLLQQADTSLNGGRSVPAGVTLASDDA